MYANLKGSHELGAVGKWTVNTNASHEFDPVCGAMLKKF